MSANLYFRQSEIAAAKPLESSGPQGVMDTLENAFGSREPHLTKSDIGALGGIVAARKAANMEYSVFERMIVGLEQYDEIDIFAQY